MPKTKKRKGPSESSTNFLIGAKKKGNDGNRWIVVKNKNGVRRWQKIPEKNKTAKKTTKQQHSILCCITYNQKQMGVWDGEWEIWGGLGRARGS